METTCSLTIVRNSEVNDFECVCGWVERGGEGGGGEVTPPAPENKIKTSMCPAFWNPFWL